MTPDPDRRSVLRLSLLAAVLDSIVFGAGSAAKPDPENAARVPDDAVHDFDLFFGPWRAQHRRLKQPLANDNEWMEFDGTSTTQRLLGGYGNLDDNVFYLPGGTYRGVSLRAFDVKAKRWAIWWLDARDPQTLAAPMTGRFENGVGTFFGDDTLRGKPIEVRHTWSHITTTSRRWEQAFSPDGGRTWETNWTTHFTRTGGNRIDEPVAVAAPRCAQLIF